MPWGIRGARWDPGEFTEPEGTDSHTECAHCGEELGEAHVVLVRHRDAHRIPDAFCSADHMVEWAKAGGRWAPYAEWWKPRYAWQATSRAFSARCGRSRCRGRSRAPR